MAAIFEIIAIILCIIITNNTCNGASSPANNVSFTVSANGLSANETLDDDFSYSFNEDEASNDTTFNRLVIACNNLNQFNNTFNETIGDIKTTPCFGVLLSIGIIITIIILGLMVAFLILNRSANSGEYDASIDQSTGCDNQELDAIV